MERLIEKINMPENQYIPAALCSKGRDGVVDDYDGCMEHCTGEDGCRGCAIQKCFDRLGEYEDTGLTPEQIEEIDEEYTKQAKELMELRKKQDNSGWIPCSERMPEEHEIMFAKYKGTDKWSVGMFESSSDEVNVTVEYEDGTRKTKSLHTNDGKWRIERGLVKFKVIAWQPLPESYKG